MLTESSTRWAWHLCLSQEVQAFILKESGQLNVAAASRPLGGVEAPLQGAVSGAGCDATTESLTEECLLIQEARAQRINRKTCFTC